MAEAPYDGLDDGEARRVQFLFESNSPTSSSLVPFNSRVDDVRLFDVGVCDVTIPWRSLSSQINRAVFATVLGAIRPRINNFREVSEHFTYTGPVFSATFGQQLAPDQRPIIDDRIAIRTAQVLRARAYEVLTPELVGAELLQLRPSLSRLPSGANIVQFRVFRAEETDPALDYANRYSLTRIISSEVTQQLREQLPSQFAAVINDQLRPILRTGSVRSSSDRVYVCNTALSGDALRENCLASIRALGVQGFGETLATTLAQQRFECVPWSEIGLVNAFTMTFRKAFCSGNNVVTAIPPIQRGFCAVRASPTRVQVVPEGLQLIMLDQANSPDANFIRSQIIEPLRRSTDFIASCDTHRRWNGSSPIRTTLQNVGEIPSVRDRIACDGDAACRDVIASSLPEPTFGLPTCEVQSP
jgi:hypothetical protein